MTLKHIFDDKNKLVVIKKGIGDVSQGIFLDNTQNLQFCLIFRDSLAAILEMTS